MNRLLKGRVGGFALIELMVATGIIALVVGGGISSYSKLVDRQKVVNVGKEFAVELREVQKRAQSGEKPVSCPGPLTGWRVERINNTSYREGAVCGGSGLDQEVVVLLPIDMVFGSGDFDYTFGVLSGEVTGAGLVSTQDTAGKYSYEIEVSAGGGISELEVKSDVLPVPADTGSPDPTPSPGPTQTMTLNPIEDAFVRSDSSSSNNGFGSQLEVEGAPIYISYIKFDLSSLAGVSVTDAKLRIRVIDGTNQDVVIKRVNASSWTEGGVNYNNRPSLGSTAGVIPGSAWGAWAEASVTGWVGESVGGVVSVGLDTVGGDDFRFRSREHSNQPELVIEYSESGGGGSGPGPTPTPSPSPTPPPQSQEVEMSPIADSFVYSGSSGSNYGNGSQLEVEGSPVYISYLKFDLAQLAGRIIEQAKLRIKIVDGSNETINIKRVADSGWSESGITYNNRPSLGASIATINGVAWGASVEIDMTGWVDDNRGSVASFAFDKPGGDDMRFRSSEHSEGPVLTVGYQ